MRLKKFTLRSILITLCGVIMAISDANAQSLSGRVVDTEGEPMIGVTVFIKELGTGAATDLDGQYAIMQEIPVGSTIEFSYLGMVTQSLVYSGTQTSHNVVLEAESESIEEIVVVGYGEQKKESVVGSITQTDGSELLRAGSVSTVSEALTGLMPGVSTMQAAGAPGATSATILIRGKATLGDDANSAPLCLVDGVERDFNDLDPNEIATISVLKDASATAVYGVKAANGVILITTKSGESGKTIINFSSSLAIKNPTTEAYDIDYPTVMREYNRARINDGLYEGLFPDSEIDKWEDPNRNMDFYSYTNMMDYVLGTGISQQYNVNASGGNDFVKFFASAGYNYDGDIFNIEKQPGYDPRTYQKRYTYRGNLDFKITKTTNFSVKLSGDVKHWNGNDITEQSDAGVANGGSRLLRLYQTVQVGPPPISSDGKLCVQSAAVDANYFDWMQFTGQEMRNSNRLSADFGFTQKLAKTLKLGAKYSYNQNRSYKSAIRATPLKYIPGANETFVQLDPDQVPTLPVVGEETMTAHSYSIYYEASLNYSEKFGKHAVSALGLFNRRELQSNVEFPRLEESWVARATYSYDNKYLFEFNGAYNGNENFAPGKRFGFFPSAAVGWVVSEEKFVKEKLPFFEFLKLRYSYGEVGSDKGLGKDRYTYMEIYDTYDPKLFIGGENRIPFGQVYYEGRPADPDNSWETAIKQNFGVEMTFLQGRLRSSVDFFDEKRKGILNTVNSIPTWFGNSKPIRNIGETKNHGIDVDITWADRIGNDFSYFIKGNISLSENRVVYLDDLKNTEPHKCVAGKPIGCQSGYLDYGLYQSWDDVYNYPQTSLSGNNMPGDMIFSDFNGDGIIDSKDTVPIGGPSYATKTYAATFGLEYKGFSVTALFNGMFDLYKELSAEYLWETSMNSGLGFRINNDEQLDYWTPENTGAEHPALHTTANAHNQKQSTYTFRKSNFLRLRNLEVKYRFNNEMLKKTGFVRGLEVYANGQNLFTWSPLPDAFDPEAKQLAVYPISKRYNIGLRFSF